MKSVMSIIAGESLTKTFNLEELQVGVGFVLNMVVRVTRRNLVLDLNLMKEILILIEPNFEQNFLHVFHTF